MPKIKICKRNASAYLADYNAEAIAELTRRGWLVVISNPNRVKQS